MTNMELNTILGKHIRAIDSLAESNEEAVFEIKKATAMAQVAKRLVQANGQTIMVDRMCGRTDRANKVVGE